MVIDLIRTVQYFIHCNTINVVNFVTLKFPLKHNRKFHGNDLIPT